ncbi:DUF1702 family protein [Anabaena subtropica]|uniref:DUF1702 family protein n=1 Tax=Anabaena subtropica FACHB-260 TaxID=2692884 RepID=A0ABR8CHX8_9NOST|nr:DUF1702 family protein [Anabaena subtropica]MBD2342820.1 DUF1702 family protein [Anabaena subtropica FACHB-260]
MIPNFGSLRRAIFGISTEVMDSSWQKLNIPDSYICQQLRESTTAFVNGYNIALETGFSENLTTRLKAFKGELPGYAYTGASMGLAILDYIPPGNQQRLQRFIDANPEYISSAHIGAGFAIAVLKRNVQQSLAQMIPLQRWWAIDGFGFHAGLLNWKSAVLEQVVPQKLTGYATRAFDQGLGRGIWFLYGGDVPRIIQQLQSFPAHRHGDLWSGIALACTHTCGINEQILQDLKLAAGGKTSYLALGAALAAHPRYLTNQILDHTNLACDVLCGMSAIDAARLTLDIIQGLTIDEQEAVSVDQPIYETYREGVRTHFLKNTVTV